VNIRRLMEKFEVLPGSARQVRLRWEKGKQQCTLVVDLDSYRSVIAFSDEERDGVLMNSQSIRLYRTRLLDQLR
jgi:hypothetical protein